MNKISRDILTAVYQDLNPSGKRRIKPSHLITAASEAYCHLRDEFIYNRGLHITQLLNVFDSQDLYHIADEVRNELWERGFYIDGAEQSWASVEEWPGYNWSFLLWLYAGDRDAIDRLDATQDEVEQFLLDRNPPKIVQLQLV